MSPRWKFIDEERFDEISANAPKVLHREEEPSMKLGIFLTQKDGTVDSREGATLDLPQGTRIGLLDEVQEQPWCYLAGDVTVSLGGREVEVKQGTPLLVLPPGYNPAD